MKHGERQVGMAAVTAGVSLKKSFLLLGIPICLFFKCQLRNVKKSSYVWPIRYISTKIFLCSLASKLIKHQVIYAF